MLRVNRPLIVQQFRTFSFAVGVDALPLEPTVDKTDLITTVVISNPIAGIAVFFGNGGVTITSGLEILPGTTPMFVIEQEGRQMYELQGPLLDIDAGLQCRNIQAEAIPFIVWSPANMYLVAAAPTTVSVCLFKAMFI